MTETMSNGTIAFYEYDAYNRWNVESERLPDATLVYVASCMDRDGCIAQGATRDEAVALLGLAREEYDRVL